MFTSKESREQVETLVKSESVLRAKIQELENNLSSVRQIAESKISENEAQSIIILDKISKILNDADSKNKDINDVNNEINQILEDFKKNKTQLSSAIQQSNIIAESVKNLNQIQSELDINQQKIIKSQTELQAILAPSTQAVERITAFDTTVATIVKSIDTQKTAIEKSYSEIIDIYNEICGDDDGTGVRSGGLKEQLEVSYQELSKKISNLTDELVKIKEDNVVKIDAFITSSEHQRDDLITNIRSYLPEGVSAGLAGAFYEKKKEEKTAMHTNFLLFGGLIILMIIMGGIPLSVYFHWFSTGKTLEDIIKLVPNMTLSLIPLYMPCIWLAIHLNKNINLNKKLIEEYAYKEAINKTFVGVTEQINTLKDENVSSEIQSQLIKLIILANSDNPGRYITGYNDTENPFFQLLSALSEAGSNVSANVAIGNTTISESGGAKDNIKKDAITKA